jgi:hypothetical protein
MAEVSIKKKKGLHCGRNRAFLPEQQIEIKGKYQLWLQSANLKI